MSLFTLKCPHCGIKLEADEKDIGENVSCGECDFHFVLSRDTEQSMFKKKLDWSTLTQGVTIPAKKHDAFLKNISVPLARGESHRISVRIENKQYPANIINVGFANPNRQNTIQILWSRKTALAKTLQATFHNAYVQMQSDHGNREGIGEAITVACGNVIDEFILELGIPVTPIREQETDRVFENGEKKSDNRSSGHPKTFASQRDSDVNIFISALLKEFPAGCEWTNSTVNLLKKAVGQETSDEDMQMLKRLMFKRSDGVYLLPEMVADTATLNAMIAKSDMFLTEHLCFSLSVLFGEFKGALKHLPEPDIDFRLFFIKGILPRLSNESKVFGRKMRQMCIPASYDEQEVLELAGEQLHDTLENAGDAVLAEDLLAEHSYLNLETLNWILREYCYDTIEIKIDELQYWKLFPFFYLPDDFCVTVKETVTGIERSQKVPSLSAIANTLENQYGGNFRQDYALEDDEVLRQIISRIFSGSGYNWKNNLLVKQASQQDTNIVDEFLRTQNGVFHESDFFAYAEEHRGVKNHGMLILTFLRNKCIRLGKKHWVPIVVFERESDFSVEISNMVRSDLNTMLGQKQFLPLGTLPDAFFSSLPPIAICGQTYYWNAYMLASIAEQKISTLRIINTEPSPYTVTAMVIPTDADFLGDVIDYVFHAMRKSGYSFINNDSVFEFLKRNQIRMSKTQKLIERISAFWGAS